MSNQPDLPNLVLTDTEIEAELCRKDFYYFFKEFWGVIDPKPLIDNWHIKYCCDEVQKVGERVIDRKTKLYDLAINISPGSSKSTITSRMFLPWLWTRNRGIKYMLASYNSDISEGFMIIAKNLLNSDKYQSYFGEVKFDPKMNRNKHFRNSHGGEGVAVSVSGGTTARHADLIVLDDLLDIEHGTSAAKRLEAENYIKETIPGRTTEEKAVPIINVNQRIHKDDPTGVMINFYNNVKQLKIPAEIRNFTPKPKELEQFYVDDLMDVKRKDWSILKKKQKLGSAIYSTQYGQQPAATEGDTWKDEFLWEKDDKMPPIYDLVAYGTDWDTAFTKKTINSATAFCTGGRKGEHIFIYNIGWFWKNSPEVKEYIRSMENAGMHCIENKASGKPIFDDLKLEGVNVSLESDIPNRGDSIARAKQAMTYVSDGLVHVRKSLRDKMLHDRKQGLLDFPRNSNDDLSDAVSQTILRLRRVRSPIW